MSCEPQTFNNITPTIFYCLKEKLNKAGYPLKENEGTVKGPFGVVIEYKWDEANATLFIHIREKSFFISCDQINRVILDNLADCGMNKV